MFINLHKILPSKNYVLLICSFIEWLFKSFFPLLLVPKIVDEKYLVEKFLVKSSPSDTIIFNLY